MQDTHINIDEVTRDTKALLMHLQTTLYKAISNHHSSLLDAKDEEHKSLIYGHILALDGFCGYIEQLLEVYTKNENRNQSN